MRSPRWRRNRRLVCHCGGWWFPHRRGSRGLTHRGCYHAVTPWWWGLAEQRADRVTPGICPF
jgi:hypothetical protein